MGLFSKIFKNRNIKNVGIKQDGKIIAEKIVCPACGKRVYFINKTTVACRKDNRVWGLRDLLRTLHQIRHKPETVFVEIE